MEKIIYPHILIVQSSAGSGKTYNLALRYLQILLMEKKADLEVKNRMNNILAISFTHKAAKEMQDRIMKWMKSIILDKKIHEKDVNEIIKAPLILNSSPTLAVVKSATEIKNEMCPILENLLKDYGDFKISTIDSFVRLILKASVFRLGISPDFEISENTKNHF